METARTSLFSPPPLAMCMQFSHHVPCDDEINVCLEPRDAFNDLKINVLTRAEKVRRIKICHKKTKQNKKNGVRKCSTIRTLNLTITAARRHYIPKICTLFCVTPITKVSFLSLLTS